MLSSSSKPTGCGASGPVAHSRVLFSAHFFFLLFFFPLEASFFLFLFLSFLFSSPSAACQLSLFLSLYFIHVWFELPICGLESLPEVGYLDNRYSPSLKSRVNTSFACYFTVFFLLLPVSSLFSSHFTH